MVSLGRMGDDFALVSEILDRQYYTRTWKDFEGRHSELKRPTLSGCFVASWHVALGTSMEFLLLLESRLHSARAIASQILCSSRKPSIAAHTSISIQ